MKQLIKRVVPRRLARQFQSPDRLDELQREIAELRSLMHDQRHILLSLNHTILYGGESGLPLVVSIVDRIRSDADTTVGAVHAMERLLANSISRLETAAERLEAVATRPPANG